MHGYIYELTRKKIDKREWTKESDFDHCDKVDYVDVLHGKQRKEAIESIKGEPYFDLLFKLKDGPERLVYKGGLDTLKDVLYGDIEEELEKIKSFRQWPTYQFRRLVDCPFFSSSLFVLPHWSGPEAVFPRELLELLSTMKPRGVLYINSVFNFHY